MLEKNSEQKEQELPTNIVSAKELVRAALQRRRQAIVYGLAEHFFARLEFQKSAPTPSEVENGETWVGIESLSQLRSVVGGRFQNLKQKWVAAGLPLREHRGDRKGEATIDEDGWLALSVWINKQGYEARLVNDNENYLFEVRSTGVA